MASFARKILNRKILEKTKVMGDSEGGEGERKGGRGKHGARGKVLSPGIALKFLK